MNVIGRILILIALCTTWMQAQAHDNQTPDVQQLKEKLQQLEQEMQQLKAQVDAATPTQQTPTEVTTPPPGPQGEVETPEMKVPTNSLDVYGFVMLDSGYEFGRSDPNWPDTMRPTKLASSPTEFLPDGKTFFTVKQTRFGVKSTTPTQFGDLKTLFEFELFGTGVDAGQTTFRLRHAYGELGQFGAAQYWSLFMDTDILPNQLEYWGPSGIPWFRNIQVRWMPIRSDRFHLMFGVERPGASADQGAYAGRVELQGVVPKFDMPDFTWQTRVTQKSGHVQLAGLFRKITWVDTAPNPQFKLGDTVLGWGLNLSSNLNFTEKSVGRFDVIYGEGIENYINDAPVDVGVKNNPANPIRPISGVPLLPRILAEMIMAGLYDGSGSWAWHVGVPAKSGVGGGILAVVPGKGAMAVFAPPLDEAGNSVKAQKAIAYVADKLGINLFSPASVGLK